MSTLDSAQKPARFAFWIELIGLSSNQVQKYEKTKERCAILDT